MYWEKRKDKSGEQYYSFLQWDPKTQKNIRLRKSEVPSDLITDKQASEFCKIREAEADTSRIKILRRLSWQKKYYNFEELLQIFEKEAAIRAPNYYVTLLYYLRRYAFDFFLNVRQCNNLNSWHLHFEDFRDWLLTAPTSNSTKANSTLAYGSKNNVIGSVNMFLDIMSKKGKCEHSPKCSKFPKRLLNSRNADHVIDHSEFTTVRLKLAEIDPNYNSADFFTVLINTGLRLSEGLAISINDFYPGTPDHQVISGALKRHNLTPFGYIALESQAAEPNCPRGANGKVKRKPLKGKRKVEAKSSRMIPIFDKDTFNILAKLYNKQVETFDAKQFGENKSDYLLFDGLDKNRFSRFLRLAYQAAKKSHKSPHCCRHTFATNFAGMANGDTSLCRLVLGHRDEETTLGYIHLFEQINRKIKTQSLIKTRITLVE